MGQASGFQPVPRNAKVSQIITFHSQRICELISCGQFLILPGFGAVKLGGGFLRAKFALSKRCAWSRFMLAKLELFE